MHHNAAVHSTILTLILSGILHQVIAQIIGPSKVLNVLGLIHEAVLIHNGSYWYNH